MGKGKVQAKVQVLNPSPCSKCTLALNPGPLSRVQDPRPESETLVMSPGEKVQVLNPSPGSRL